MLPTFSTKAAMSHLWLGNVLQVGMANGLLMSMSVWSLFKHHTMLGFLSQSKFVSISFMVDKEINGIFYFRNYQCIQNSTYMKNATAYEA